MSIGLTKITEEVIESLLDGTTAGSRGTQSPFANAHSGIPLLFQQLGNRHLLLRQSQVKCALRSTGIFITSHISMSGMFPCHQAATRWSTDCRTTIMLHELQAVCGKAIDIRSMDLVLFKIAVQIPDAHIVCQYKYDIRQSVRSGLCICHGGYHTRCYQAVSPNNVMSHTK